MSYRGRKVFVTGADGFIGSHLVETLVKEGADVTALSLYQGLDRHGWLDDVDARVRQNIRIVRGDVRDSTMMLRLVAGQDIVFHLAALIAIPHSYDAPLSYIDVNVVGTANILEAARAHNTPRVVHTSTSEVYGTAQFVPITEKHPLVAQSPYAASKIAADKLAESYALSFDMPVTILRPFNTYGPRQSERAVIASTIRQAIDPACDAIHVGDIHTVRDFNYVIDTVQAFLAIGLAQKLQSGHAYNAGSGTGVTIAEMIDIVRELSGTNKPIVSDSDRKRPAKSEVMELVAEAGQFSSASGWKPRYVLRDGLSETVDWWRKQLSGQRLRHDAHYIR